MWEIRVFVDGTGCASLAKEIDVHGDERKDNRGHNENVGDKETRESQRAHIRTTAHEALEPTSDQWNFTSDVRSYCRGEVSFLIPRQEIAGEGHAEH